MGYVRVSIEEQFINSKSTTMKYFPLESDRFEHQFGVRAIARGESIVEATELYEAEISLKREMIARDTGTYFAANDDSMEAQIAAAKLVCDSAPFLSRTENRCTEEPISVEQITEEQITEESIAGGDVTPLLAIARHVQEDLLIIGHQASDGFPLIAGVVCFPSGWSVGDKLGQSMLAIHHPVPQYEAKLHQRTARLLESIRIDRPVWRMNWGVRPSNRLDQSPIHADRLNQQRSAINGENAGERCFFRVERQTLARIPETSDILFAIHTHQCKLNDLSDRQRCRLANVLDSCPPETLAYKGIMPMADALRDYFRWQA